MTCQHRVRSPCDRTRVWLTTFALYKAAAARYMNATMLHLSTTTATKKTPTGVVEPRAR
jgi:hypothetical protein